VYKCALGEKPAVDVTPDFDSSHLHFSQNTLPFACAVMWGWLEGGSNLRLVLYWKVQPDKVCLLGRNCQNRGAETCSWLSCFNVISLYFFSFGAATQHGSWPPHSWSFLDHTQRRTTVGRSPLDEWSARRRDLYLTTHNTHNKHPCPRWDSNPRFQQASGRRVNC
jgi:hypothetical protein